MRIPSYKTLRAFEAVSRLGTLRAAADEMNVTHSAVSHLLKDLEEALGVQLVERKGRGLQITPNGELLAAGLRDGFERLHAAVEIVANDVRRERLTIACLPSVAARWMVPRLSHFRTAHPNIQLRINYNATTATTAPTALAHGADVVITWVDGQYYGPGQAQRLFDGTTYPVCSPLYLDHIGPIRTPADLLKAELLHDLTPSTWRSWFRAQGLTARIRDSDPVYEDFNLMSFALLAGHGVALAPMTLLRNELEQGLLTQLFDMPSNSARAYWVITPDECSPAAARFSDWITQTARAQS